MDQIVGRASGKLLLFGEHAAVYGHPALGCGLSKTCSVTLIPEPQSTDLRLPYLEELAPEASQELVTTMKRLVPGFTLPGGTFHVESDIPVSAGMGSSAALCGALSQILLSLAGEDHPGLLSLLPETEHLEGWSPEERRFHLLWYIANELEHVFHGTPSGIDTALALSQGTLALFPRPRQLPDVLPLADPGLPLLIGALPRQSSTKQLVSSIRSAMIKEDPDTEEAMEHLGDCAHRAIQLLETPTPWDQWTAASRVTLGQTMNRAHQILSSLGLSTAQVDQILTKAETMGALGSKLSGAGGGGTFIILARDKESAADIAGGLNDYARQSGIDLLTPLTLI
ncbi:mevalonate kinase [Spirochaeta lutea]|uniref:mevalonate kinase n=1 Tax=Spirochaeta lutea TaxID=1480694 RepID=A0A098QUE4_9SPIO|nr:mevalonate kinase [Spirochaeta lutea]KGE71206.1 hypothetical protein DC28_12165 [Spirochaeta lutea]